MKYPPNEQVAWIQRLTCAIVPRPGWLVSLTHLLLSMAGNLSKCPLAPCLALLAMKRSDAESRRRSQESVHMMCKLFSSETEVTSRDHNQATIPFLITSPQLCQFSSPETFSFFSCAEHNRDQWSTFTIFSRLPPPRQRIQGSSNIKQLHSYQVGRGWL